MGGGEGQPLKTGGALHGRNADVDPTHQQHRLGQCAAVGWCWGGGVKAVGRAGAVCHGCPRWTLRDPMTHPTPADGSVSVGGQVPDPAPPVAAAAEVVGRTIYGPRATGRFTRSCAHTAHTARHLSAALDRTAARQSSRCGATATPRMACASRTQHTV